MSDVYDISKQSTFCNDNMDIVPNIRLSVKALLVYIGFPCKMVVQDMQNLKVECLRIKF